MQYFGKCISALLTPWGRISPGPFAALALLLIAIHCAIQMYLTGMGEDLPPYNAWSMSLFIMMWFGFCITSRRFHDSGKTAFYLVPLLVVTFASYLAVLDNLHLASSVFDEDRDLLRWSERVRFALQVLGMVAMIGALVRPSDEGDNAFGHVFYDANAVAARTHGTTQAPVDKPKLNATDRRHAAAHPQQAARTTRGHETSPAGDAPAPATPRRRADDRAGLGPRGRITPSELVRHRGEGFGRR